MLLNLFVFTSSTLAAVLADVSMKINPCSRANASPSSFWTSRRAKRSLNKETGNVSNNNKKNSLLFAYHLFPISIMTIFEFECCRASSSQLVKWLNVWRLKNESICFVCCYSRIFFTEWYRRQAEHQLHLDSTNEWSNGNFLVQPKEFRNKIVAVQFNWNLQCPRFAILFVYHQ